MSLNLINLVCMAFFLKTMVTFANPSYYRAYYYNAKCTDPETNGDLYIDDYFTRHGQCIRVKCLDTLEIAEERCSVPILEGSCHHIPPANDYLDYPKCCPLYECSLTKYYDNMNVTEIGTYNQYGQLIRKNITRSVKNYMNSRGEIIRGKPPVNGCTNCGEHNNNEICNNRRVNTDDGGYVEKK